MYCWDCGLTVFNANTSDATMQVCCVKCKSCNVSFEPAELLYAVGDLQGTVKQ